MDAQSAVEELKDLFEAVDRIPHQYKVVLVLMGESFNHITGNVPIPEQLSMLRKAWRKLRRAG